MLNASSLKKSILLITDRCSKRYTTYILLDRLAVHSCNKEKDGGLSYIYTHEENENIGNVKKLQDT